MAPGTPVGAEAGEKTSSAKLTWVLAGVPARPLPRGGQTAGAQRGSRLGQAPTPASSGAVPADMPRCCLLAARSKRSSGDNKIAGGTRCSAGQHLTLTGLGAAGWLPVLTPGKLSLAEVRALAGREARRGREGPVLAGSVPGSAAERPCDCERALNCSEPQFPQLQSCRVG